MDTNIPEVLTLLVAGCDISIINEAIFKLTNQLFCGLM